MDLEEKATRHSLASAFQCIIDIKIPTPKQAIFTLVSDADFN